ncbi:hypothetical protein CAC42_5750 [Sphaceloma murrayae]|uniref:Inhibitor of growth protein N-terminal histone-binding domain-containing protein n=1 Tax=Sphaceloma murrayae TaxID=2082308 RepID=A0A2K1QZ77_9PEZI|nr:hypothetical protein CAC42_5750 [Sphaceloma murrayae]
MPPTTAVRKTQNAQEQSRRSSGRQIRTSISRPTNYYARPFGSIGGPEEVQDDGPPGFFPAIQHFTDAVDELPKEVMRHFTLMKEVEAKIHGPTQNMVQVVNRIASLPTPSRRNHQPSHQSLLSFTANNSSGVNSANASVINGALPGFVPPSVAEAAAQAAQPTQAEQLADMQRRQEFYNLRVTISQVLASLDERNVCLAEANRTLDRQLGRMHRVLPHVEAEINEEARLGSLSHWAYADNKKKAQQAPERNRRDIAVTSNLAAAAAAVHEGDIAAARNEGREKTKKSRAQHVDSEFEDRGVPKKSHHKGRKAAELAEAKNHNAGTAGLQPPKKRKVEKVGGAAMERTSSAVGKSAKVPAGTPRATPANEAPKKKTKPAIPPIKKGKPNAGSPAQSPRMAVASPTMANFSFPGDASNQRPSSRMRQGSSTLQHSTLANKPDPPTNGEKKVNGEKRQNGADSKNAAVESIEDSRDTEVTESRNGNGNANARGDATLDKTQALSDPDTRPGTAGSPDGDSAPMVRTRSNGVRSTEPNIHAQKTSARNGERSHSRAGSNQHMLKQIASFNKSPRTARRELQGSSGGSSTGDDKVEVRPKRQGRSSRRQESRQQTPEERDDDVADEDDAVDEDRDPDDPDEPKYCYCNRGSYGTMVGCENDACQKSWFHLECIGLDEVPDESVKWR